MAVIQVNQQSQQQVKKDQATIKKQMDQSYQKESAWKKDQSIEIKAVKNPNKANVKTTERTKSTTIAQDKTNYETAISQAKQQTNKQARSQAIHSAKVNYKATVKQDKITSNANINKAKVDLKQANLTAKQNPLNKAQKQQNKISQNQQIAQIKSKYKSLSNQYEVNQLNAKQSIHELKLSQKELATKNLFGIKTSGKFHKIAEDKITHKFDAARINMRDKQQGLSKAQRKSNVAAENQRFKQTLKTDSKMATEKPQLTAKAHAGLMRHQMEKQAQQKQASDAMYELHQQK